MVRSIVQLLSPRTSADASLDAVNYIDSTYSADVAHKKYYPTHTARLTDLKNKYDPKRVIHHPQDF